jgi:hypothetical protein
MHLRKVFFITIAFWAAVPTVAWGLGSNWPVMLIPQSDKYLSSERRVCLGKAMEPLQSPKIILFQGAKSRFDKLFGGLASVYITNPINRFQVKQY